jgi:hypothetical protein
MALRLDDMQAPGSWIDRSKASPMACPFLSSLPCIAYLPWKRADGCASVLLVRKTVAPAAAVAERLVLRPAAPAKRVGRARTRLPGNWVTQGDASGHCVGSVSCDDNRWQGARFSRLGHVQRVTQGARRAVPDSLDDRRNAGARGIDPRLAPILEDGGQSIGAAPCVSAKRPDVVDRDSLGAIVLPHCRCRSKVCARKTVALMGAVAERLVCGTSTAAQCHNRLRWQAPPT